MKTWDEVEQEEDDAGAAERVDEAGGGAGRLVAELDPVTVEPAALDLGDAVETSNVVTTYAKGKMSDLV